MGRKSALGLGCAVVAIPLLWFTRGTGAPGSWDLAPGGEGLLSAQVRTTGGELRAPEGARVSLGPRHIRESIPALIPEGEDLQPLEADARELTYAQAVRDLLDDNVRGNAALAMRFLHTRMEEAFPEVEVALFSQDYQQRQFSGVLFGWRAAEGKPVPPRLWPVLVEGLRKDPMRWRFPFANRSVSVLISHGAPAESLLRKALHSDDTQQCFLSAAILAWRKDDASVALTCRILGDHLNDNQSSGDAGIACSALSALGELAGLHLRVSRSWADEQGRQLIDFCLQNFEELAPNSSVAYDRVWSIPGRPLNRNPFTADAVGDLRSLRIRK